jgi:hypothetical protein
MSSPLDCIFNYNNNPSLGIIAQEVGEMFPNYIISEPKPTPVLSVTAPPENNIVFHSGKAETLKITEDGFYVRGVKVPADDKEAAAVYKAFKEFLVYHALTRN